MAVESTPAAEGRELGDEIAELAGRIRQGQAGAPVRLTLEDFRLLADALASDAALGRATVVLLGRRAVVGFPELSAQQLIVTKSFGRPRPTDFDLASGADVVGDAGPGAPVLRAAASAALRHAWWFLPAWVALWWLLLVLGDFAFASRLSELALTGSVVTFVLLVVIDRQPVPAPARDALVTSGVWQSLDASDRAANRLAVVAALVSLKGVLLSHSTMVSLQARGLFEPFTSAPVRAILTSALSSGAVVLLALALAAAADARGRRRLALEDLQAAMSIVAARRPPAD